VTELEQVIKDKKNAAADADLQLKKLDHDMQSLRKDRSASASKVHDLEKLHEWILEEKE
jgi:structural maintenance of chromosome 2